MQFSATARLPGDTDEHPATMISESDREEIVVLAVNGAPRCTL